MDIWKLLGALAITTALSVGGAYGFSELGWINPLQPKAWLVLSVTTLGLLLKLLFGDLATGEFHYHKHGYDLCVLTMGAGLSGLSLQLLSDKSLFPGLSSTGPIALAKLVTNDAVQQCRIILFVVFLTSCFTALLTARISKAVKGGAKGKHLLSLINFAIGAATLGWYVLILVTKG